MCLRESPIGHAIIGLARSCAATLPAAAPLVLLAANPSAGLGTKIKTFQLPENLYASNLSPKGDAEITGNTIGRVANLSGNAVLDKPPPKVTKPFLDLVGEMAKQGGGGAPAPMCPPRLRA